MYLVRVLVRRTAIAPRHDLTFSRPRLLTGLFRRRQKENIELARRFRVGTVFPDDKLLPPG